KPTRDQFLSDAVAEFRKTLALDSEDVTAHWNLYQLYKLLGDETKAAEELKLHARYKPDDNAQERAVNKAREKSAAANHAAENLVIYSLHRRGAPGLPPNVANKDAVRTQEAGGGQ